MPREALYGEALRGSSNWYDLELGEVARKPYPFPDKDECPHCGNRVGNMFRATFFHCHKCGTVIEKYPELLVTEETTASQTKKETVICISPKCRKIFTRRVIVTSDLHDYCQVCRGRIRNNRVSKAKREKRLAQNQNLKCADPADAVRTVTDGNSYLNERRKENS